MAETDDEDTETEGTVYRDESELDNDSDDGMVLTHDG